MDTTVGTLAALLSLVGSLTLTGTGERPQASAVSSAGLAPFSSCEQLRRWYVDRTIDQVGPYGWDQPMVAYTTRSGAAEDLAQSDASAPATNGATGTNTQEAGIDEPDVAKTDGRVVVRVQGRRVVVTDVTGTEPRDIGAWTAPHDQVPSSLLLVEGHALVTADSMGGVLEDRAFPVAATTRVYDLDLTDPASPTLVGTRTWSGRLLSMRQYDDVVRVVTSDGLPDLPFVRPGRGISQERAIQRNRSIVRDATIEQWVSSVDCSRVYHPVTGGADTTTVTVHTLGQDAEDDAVAVTGGGNDVYSSADRLYVWATDYAVPLATRSKASVRPVVAPSTVVHAFALQGDDTEYVASGRIGGQVRDRWSFDEHDGHLRVAVAYTRRFGQVSPDAGVSSTDATGDNGVVVLDEQGDRLVQVGHVRGLGVDEQIQSVRWFDDLAVLVTFRQTDPLYTVDVSDPEQPRVLGALEIPGFSTYLHPIGGDRLLGLGVDATDQGQARGAKVAVFDVADTRAVRRLDERRFGDDTWLSEDPHAFTWIPRANGSGTAIAQLDTAQSTRGSRQVAVGVGANGRLTVRELPRVGGWQPRALPLPDGRVALVGERVAVTVVGS